ncbi:flagellar basal body rod protein FlgB [Leeia sp.]|uniref:flagellar basal body rod protein FlgB n=1 Tax=Leeia sp. TaxID=2884678 RepID=UPI0035B3FF25
MIQNLDKHFNFLQTALKARASRQELLGANLANADTPNYKAVDVDFRQALQNALAGTQHGAHMHLTHSRHLDGAQAGFLDADVKYRNPTQPAIDGNTVDAEEEMARFSENGLHYQALLTFTTGRIRTLQQALSNN